MRRIPRVAEGALQATESLAENITVGSPSWVSWLADPATRSFSFRGSCGIFTARKEHRSRGGEYWVAYRKRGGKLKKTYLGRAEDLSSGRLEEAAAMLDGCDEGSPASPTSEAVVVDVEPPAGTGRGDARSTSVSRDHVPEHPHLALPADPLLTAKLSVPPVRADLVPRPRLTERLRAGLAGKLTLVSAPAGSGKTTLLSAWRLASSDDDMSLGWVSLDDGDNDPGRFWRYFITAMSRLRPGIGEAALALLGSPQAPPIEAILTTLLNDLTALPADVVLVLDDYHVIETEAIHRALDFLLDHLPSRLRLIVVTRADPPLPLARLRARGEMAELRAADLRFTPGEAATFFNRVMGLGLSAEDIAELETRTEGWIAGLQLAALAMRDHADIAGFIAAFAGSNRYVVDYLAQEVLERQPEHVRAFLLRTSVLERMCAPLCDAVAARGGGEHPGAVPDSQAMLEHLEHANLFVVPLDDERGWYRYHHLFADVLRQRLRQSRANFAPELHRRASEWFEQHGLVYEAVGHALRAEDFGRAATLIEAAAPPAIGRGEYETLLRWLDALPSELVGSRPRLGLSAAWALTAGGKYEESEARLRELETSAKVAEFAGEIATLHSANLLLHDLPRSITYARLALEQLPEHDLFLRGVVAVNLGMGEIIDGDLAAAGRYSAEAAEIAERTGNRFVAVVANNNLAEVRERQGRLHEAVELYRRALASASDSDGHPLPTGGAVMASTHLGRVLYKVNDLDGAERYLTRAIRLGEQGRTVEVLWITYLSMAHMSQTLGDVEAALGWRDRAERIARESNQPYGVALAAASRVWLRLAVGGDEATRRAREYADDLNRTDVTTTPLPMLVREIQQLTLARSLIFLGEPDRALLGLAETLRAAETTGRIGTMIEVHVLRAVALHTRGGVGGALAALERALTLAEPGGYVRVFVDEGDPMEALLSELLKARRKAPRDARQHALLGYVRWLLTAFESPHAGTEPPSPAQQETDRALPEPLTTREREVLGLISAGLSNGEIATRLFIATSTVKWYVNAIFRKLEVDSRTKAVARARELHLVSEQTSP